MLLGVIALDEGGEVVVVEELVDRLFHLLVDVVAETVVLLRPHLLRRRNALLLLRLLLPVFLLGNVRILHIRPRPIVQGASLRGKDAEPRPRLLGHGNRRCIYGLARHFQAILLLLALLGLGLIRTDIVRVRAFKPIQPVKLINRVDVPPSDQQVVYLLLEEVVLSDHAIQDLFEELHKTGPVVDFFVGCLEEGDDFED